KTVLATTLSYNLELAECSHVFITAERHEDQIEKMKMARTLEVPGAELTRNPAKLKDLDTTFDPLDVPKRCCHYFHKPGL
ncbi:hypothetical protein ABTD49_21500, partial [Acinetobacter baumannii]